MRKLSKIFNIFTIEFINNYLKFFFSHPKKKLKAKSELQKGKYILNILYIQKVKT